MKLSYLILLFFCFSAYAHDSSNSYLTLNLQEQQIKGSIEVAVLDIENRIGLDRNLDQKITWAEIRTQQKTISDYVLSQFSIQSCQLTFNDLLINNHNNEAYLYLKFTTDCPANTPFLKVDYDLFFQQDSLHRGFLTINKNQQQTSYLFSPRQRHFEISFKENPFINQFINYFQQGVWHIWIGFDHILFLLNLLLPAVFLYRNSFKKSFKDILIIVTAFTLAHSITLILATTKILSFSSQWIEFSIALSILLVAINNLFSFFIKQRWILAFGFGLLHGFGFASVLLALDFNNLVTSLVAFNIGVEAGQLAIVSCFFPIIYVLRHTLFYRVIIFYGGSIASIVIALFWMSERIVK